MAGPVCILERVRSPSAAQQRRCIRGQECRAQTGEIWLGGNTDHNFFGPTLNQIIKRFSPYGWAADVHLNRRSPWQIVLFNPGNFMSGGTFPMVVVWHLFMSSLVLEISSVQLWPAYLPYSQCFPNTSLLFNFKQQFDEWQSSDVLLGCWTAPVVRLDNFFSFLSQLKFGTHSLSNRTFSVSETRCNHLIPVCLFWHNNLS